MYGTCAAACEGPGLTTACGGCVRLSVSASHCGACGRQCVLRPNAFNSCVEGACQMLCRAGFLDCNGNAADGCETNVVALPDEARRCPGAGDAGVDAASDAR